MFKESRILLGACALLLAAPSQAAIITVYGDDVSFTYDDSTLFGTGTVIGNNIFFTPTDFIAESLNGAGMVETIETLNVQVQTTTEGFWLSDFAVAEQGDYQLVGEGASASVGGHFTVSSNTSSNTATDLFDAGPLTVQNTLTQWDLDSVISLSDNAGWGSDTDVDLELHNVASAETLALGEEAFVQKKIGGVAVMVTAVPVPAAAWLFGTGLFALAGWQRRRKA